MLKQKNTKKQGDVGLGVAIGYFVSKGYTVSVPLTDSQDYDLVVDMDGLKRIQVKTTSYKLKSGSFFVSLTIKGGNRTGIGKIKKFDKDTVDYVFILTDETTKYLIPSTICKQTVALCADYDRFILG